VVSPATCGSAHVLACGATGALTCDGSSTLTNCAYNSCSVTAGASCTPNANEGGGTLASGATRTEYQSNSDATCTAETMTCTNGTLSCSVGNMASDCQYSSCLKTCAANANQGGGTLASGGTKTEYQSNSDATCTAETMTCTDGTLSCSVGNMSTDCQYANCSKTCAPNANQGGGTMPSGATRTEYQANSSPTCTAETMTCTNGTLSCSVGNMTTDCLYSSCTVSGGGSLDTKLPGTGCSAGALLGETVAVGDINGDGYADLIIGAPSNAPGGRSNAGSVFVIFGSSTGIPAVNPCTGLNGTNGFELDSPTSGEIFGNSIAVGDINGDGKADIIVGTAWGSYTANNAGTVYVIFGKANGWAASYTLTAGAGNLIDGTQGFRLDGVALDNYAGYYVAAGDINGDGKADLIISAPNVQVGSNANAGAIYVVMGKAGAWSSTQTLATGAGNLIDGTQGFRLDGAAANFHLGEHGMAVGDINGDGKADILASTDNSKTFLLLGAPNVGGKPAMKSGTNWATTNVLTAGTAPIDGTSGLQFNGETGALGGAGNSLAAADVNGDGKADIILGVQADSNGTNGHAYVVYGTASLSSIVPSTTVSTTFHSTAATVASFAGLQVGQTIISANIPAGDTIAACGGATLCSSTSITLSVRASATAAGTPFQVANTALIPGGSLIDGTHGFRLDGVSSGDLTGSSIAAGDVNHDGYADILIGATDTAYNGSNSGSVYVIFGKANGWSSTQTLNTGAGNLIDGTHGFRLDGPAANYNAGNCVAAGDFNNDTYADIAVCADYISGSVPGAVFVVPGKSGAWSSTNTLQ
jgi:hypothetical protein